MVSITAVKSPLPLVRPGIAKSLKLTKSVHITQQVLVISHIRAKRTSIRSTSVSPWEPSRATYTATEDVDSSNIFDSLKPQENTTEEESISRVKVNTGTTKRPSEQLQPLKWPLWLMGPCLLLATGMAPTLWLPISSIYLGPNIASLLSLIGLDCIFNLGAMLFLLMADSCARPKNASGVCVSKAPLTYQIWNMIGNIVGCIIPLVPIIFVAQNAPLLQTQLPFISSVVLLGPYLLLLSVQILTEMLTWHWKSPVWLVTPIIYEGYRILQLMRGLKLSAELSAPAWMVHTIKGLICWWLLILGIQLMRVAWYAGFTARTGEKGGPASVANGDI